MLLQLKTLVLGLLAAIVLVGLLIAPNRSRFLLAIGTATAAFQIEKLIAPFGAIVTFSHITFLILLLVSFFDNRGRQNIRYSLIKHILWPWLGLILFAMLAVSKAINVENARAPLILFSFDLIIFFAVLRTVKTANDIRFFVGCLMAALMFQGVLGILQFKFPFFKIGVIDQVQSYMWWRAKGTFFHANHFGMYLMIMMPIAIRAVVNAMVEKNSAWITYGFVSVGIGLVALLASYNRGSMVGLVCGLMIMLAVDFTRRGVKIRRIISNLLAVAFFCVGLLSIKFAPKVYDRFFHSDANDQIEGRNEQMREAMEVISKNPIIGVGYGNDKYYASVIFVHNLYLLITTETGIPGSLLFIWFLLEIFREIWPMCRSSVLYCANYARGALAAMLGFCLSSWAGPDFWINYGVRSYFWLMVAFVYALSRLNRTVLAKQREMAMVQKQRVVPVY